ncbi:MAG: substrate-binding domain-containing protein [Coriobacteriia bacterium]|nr:substrate-binding domain-containing protein [Coriobacteriia bacterium]MDR2714180.1 substrate-binding domain-containing protein [Coriobacteriales bacterium]
MKKNTFKVIALSLVFVLAGFAMVGCGGDTPAENGNEQAGEQAGADSAALTGAINVVSREDGSGTRGAFVELFEVQFEDKDGKKVDATTSAAVITNSTSVMMTTVAGDVNSIGYISLGSLNSDVTALDIDGCAATAENVKSGAYAISRPFIIATKSDVSDAAQDFMNFIMSAEGQAVIADNKYIAIDEAAAAYASNGASGKVVVAGSSSVTPVMEKLKEAYEAANSGVSIEINQSDSSTGMSNAIDGVCDIGMSSRELKDSELEGGLTPTSIAIDGIAVIVNNNRGLSALTKEQVTKIFLGDTTDWSAL